MVANDVGGVGGMEKHLEEMIQRLKQDYPVTVVSSSFRVKDPSGVRFIRIPTIRKPFPLMITMFFVLASLRLWFMRKCIIHTTGSIVFNHVDLSTIHFCHAGYISAVGDDGANKKGLAYRLNASLSMRLKLWTERFCYRMRRTRRLVAVSSRIRKELIGAYAYPERSIDIIPNGVDIHRFRPVGANEKQQLRKDKNLPIHGTYLLFMGGDWERKGLRWLIHAFNILADDYKDLQVIVVGSGDAHDYRETVRPEHQNRVHFVGRQSDPECWYRLADVFVFPSQYEACSLAVLEAASSGLAMVVTDVGGASDIVDDGVTGCIVEPYGADIARRIRDLLDEPMKLSWFGRAVRTRVESMTWDDTYNQFKKIYDGMYQTPKDKTETINVVSSPLHDKEGATHHAI